MGAPGSQNDAAAVPRRGGDSFDRLSNRAGLSRAECAIMPRAHVCGDVDPRGTSQTGGRIDFMRRMRGARRRALLTMVAFGFCMAVLFSGGRAVERVSAVADETYDELETFSNILSIVQKNYVEEVGTKELLEGAINGMLGSLDPHSAYLTPELYKELQVDTKGSFGGLGIEITNRNGMLTVGAPIEDTPAYRAGIKPQDIILKIDGEFTKDMSLVEAVKRM